ncbi:hypothetical protein Cadr_000020120 [Camelus dromedarius]|uniref:Uncharacterized protein n=1 Tax=Camelus dromedarius TaxID=9838 RepID=A0A5N4D0I4_CAMDR|nr:hypothetical protein Cadr_000020120 [Camelus dromedarius]
MCVGLQWVVPVLRSLGLLCSHSQRAQTPSQPQLSERNLWKSPTQKESRPQVSPHAPITLPWLMGGPVNLAAGMLISPGLLTPGLALLTKRALHLSFHGSAASDNSLGSQRTRQGNWHQNPRTMPGCHLRSPVPGLSHQDSHWAPPGAETSEVCELPFARGASGRVLQNFGEAHCFTSSGLQGLWSEKRPISLAPFKPLRGWTCLQGLKCARNPAWGGRAVKTLSTYVTPLRSSQIPLIGGGRASVLPPRPRIRPPAVLPRPLHYRAASAASKLEREGAGANGPRPSKGEGTLFCLGLTVAGNSLEAQSLSISAPHRPFPLLSLRPTTPAPFLQSIRKCPLPRPSSTPTSSRCQEVGPRGTAARHAGSRAQAARDPRPEMPMAVIPGVSLASYNPDLMRHPAALRGQCQRSRREKRPSLLTAGNESLLFPVIGDFQSDRGNEMLFPPYWGGCQGGIGRVEASTITHSAETMWELKLPPLPQQFVKRGQVEILAFCFSLTRTRQCSPFSAE